MFLDRSHRFPLRQGTALDNRLPTMSQRRTHSPVFKALAKGFSLRYNR